MLVFIPLLLSCSLNVLPACPLRFIAGIFSDSKESILPFIHEVLKVQRVKGLSKRPNKKGQSNSPGYQNMFASIRFALIEPEFTGLIE